MTTQSFAAKEPTADRNTVMNDLISKFYVQCGRFDQLLNDLETMGHKLRNTNYPTPEKISELKGEAPPEGMLTDLSACIYRIDIYNNRLEQINKKLSELI